MALPVNGSTHLIPAYYSFCRPQKDERLSWPSWLTYSGWLTHQLQVERRTGKVRRPETDVLPLCHATNYMVIVDSNNFNYCQQCVVYDEKQLKVVKLNVFVTLSDGGQSLIFEEHGVSISNDVILAQTNPHSRHFSICLAI